MAEQQLQQVVAELAKSRAQIMRLSAEMDTLRANAQQAVANSEARMTRLINDQAARGGGGEDKIDIVDFKAAQPEPFKGRRDESWKLWSRSFRTYCNVRKQGFRQALEWSENFQHGEIDLQALDSMNWAPARAANEKLYDFLSLICKDDAHMLVEQYEGMGL